jgi:hypothetical protein
MVMLGEMWEGWGAIRVTTDGEALGYKTEGLMESLERALSIHHSLIYALIFYRSFSSELVSKSIEICKLDFMRLKAVASNPISSEL